MQVDGKPPAVSTTNAAASGGGFSTVVERILSTAERRESSLLTPGELQALSELSAAQSSMQQGGKLADDLGFADVDPDLIGQLVGTLEKQVVAASAINIIQLSYNAAKAIQTKQSPGNNSKLTMDQASPVVDLCYSFAHKSCVSLTLLLFIVLILFILHKNAVDSISRKAVNKRPQTRT
jgi:hypothetical protein